MAKRATVTKGAGGGGGGPGNHGLTRWSLYRSSAGSPRSRRSRLRSDGASREEGTLLRGLLLRASAWATTFSASLDLAKQGEVAMAQAEAFGAVYLKPFPKDSLGDCARDARAAQNFRRQPSQDVSMLIFAEN